MNQFCTLDLRKYAHLKANYHTHTPRCQHAGGEDRDYIERAIEAGYKVLGFSDHAPMIFDDGYVSPVRMKMSELEEYVSSLEKLRKEYEKDIQILIGLEAEYWPKTWESSLKCYQQYLIDYMIMGQHYTDDEANGKSVQNEPGTESELRDYVKRVTEGIDTGYFMYVAHPDIFRFEGDPSVYDRYMGQIVEACRKNNLPIEINCTGYRKKRVYPNPRFVELAARAGCDFIIGIDAHVPEQIKDVQTVKSCEEMVRQFGGQILSL